MIIKEKDSVEPNLAQLEKIANLPGLDKGKKLQVEKEQKILKSGSRGEQGSAYFIDFYYKDSKNWSIIHDLRIEHSGLVAQIDHLLINRFLDFYVLETKHYSQGVRITDRGEFLASFNRRYRSIESPIEQNKRHISVLKKMLQVEAVLPKRLGFSLQPNFRSYVLFSPNSRVIRPSAQEFNTKMVIKSDEFYQQTQDNIDAENVFSAVKSAANMISQDALSILSQKIATYHQPAKVDYYSRFSVSKLEPLALGQTAFSSPQMAAQENLSKYYCYGCQKNISKKEATFCFSRKARFHRKAYCYSCQKTVALRKPSSR